jgi:cell shape-determining protein MreD
MPFSFVKNLGAKMLIESGFTYLIASLFEKFHKNNCLLAAHSIVTFYYVFGLNYAVKMTPHKISKKPDNIIVFPLIGSISVIETLADEGI